MAMDSAKRLCSHGADYFNFRLMPHGGPVLFPIVLTTLGLCASLADDGCDYARLRGAAVEMLTGSAAVPFVDCGMSAYRTPGFYPAENSWRVVYSRECQPYEYMGVLADSSWVAAEWLRFLSVVAGGTTAMFLWTSTCLTLRPNYWRGSGIGVALACAFQMCSFVWFYTKLCHTSTTNIENFEAGRESEGNSKANDTSSCDLFFGSKCAISSCVLYALSSSIILFRKYPMPVPKLIVQDENDAIISGQTNSAGRRRNSFQRKSDPSANIRQSSQHMNIMSTDGTNQSSANSYPSRRNVEMSSLTRQSWTSGAPTAGGHDNNYRASRTSMPSIDEANYSSNHPMTNVRPKELSGSALSAVSFV